LYGMQKSFRRSHWKCTLSSHFMISLFANIVNIRLSPHFDLESLMQT